MPTENVYTQEEAASYSFAQVPPPPADFDPDAKGTRDCPPGEHIMEVQTFAVEINHTFKWKDQAATLNQLRPILVIPDGQPCAGASVMDFLPLPTPGRTMPTGLANRWANFVRSLGFTLTKDSLIPAEFAGHPKPLTLLIGRRCIVQVEAQTNSDGTPKLNNKGVQRVGVKFFGYLPLTRADTLSRPLLPKPTASTANAAADPGLSPVGALPAGSPQFDL